MTIHYLYRQQTLTMTPEEAWSFFTSPAHLNSITPDFFTITPVSPVPENIYSGLMIAYHMQAVWKLPMDWLSEISHCQPGEYFIYEQKIGPFKFWSHEVRLKVSEPNKISIEDIVFYKMPYGAFGELMHRLLIKQKLQAIFDTRAAVLESRFK